jgi:hypothetical protein
MQKLFSFLFLIGLFAVGACSTTSSSGTRTLSPDQELAEPKLRNMPTVVDTLSQPVDTLDQSV